METDKTVTALRKLKKTHENFTVGIGITIGFILLSYFFSFAAFIDHVKPSMVTFQLISTIIFVFCLIFLKKIALFFTKIRFGKKEPYSTLLQHINGADFEKDEQSLCILITSRLTRR